MYSFNCVLIFPVQRSPPSTSTLSTEVEVHLCKEAHIVKGQHDYNETGEARKEEKNVSLTGD